MSDAPSRPGGPGPGRSEPTLPSDEPVRFGILGAGRISRHALVPALAASARATVVAVGARDPQRAAALVAGARAYGNYEDVLADPAVEVVYCALPNDAHVPWAVAALRAGKHVLCEKPLGLDAAEVASAFEAASTADLLLVEASWYRWHPRTRRAEALVADGALGQLQSVSAGFSFAGVPADDYRMAPAHGGGALYDVGCYAASAIGWATGWRELSARSVEVLRAPGGVDLTTTAELVAAGEERDPGGTPVARLHASIDGPERQWLELVGTARTLRFEPPAFTAWTGAPAALELVDATGRAERFEFDACDPYRIMVDAVADAVRGRPAWLVTPAESLAVARLLDSVLAAGRPRDGGSSQRPGTPGRPERPLRP